MTLEVHVASIKSLRLGDYTKTPGGRFKDAGDFSGEWFRDDILEPAYDAAKAEGVILEVSLDGVMGCPPSFTEEVFGGLVRKKREDIRGTLRVVSTDDRAEMEDANLDIKNAIKRALARRDARANEFINNEVEDL